MITHLSVRNYALIDQLSIDFDSGMSVITGETGSGKSIILGALGLALGSRADHSALSASGEKCVVEVHFSISDSFQPFFAQNDLDFDSSTIIRREITSSGKSRSFVNDTPANLQVLKQLGQMLVDIHSQHENALLSDEDFRFEFLDAVGNNSNLTAEYSKAYQEWRSATSELTQLKEAQIKAAQDADYRAFQLQELEDLQLDKLDLESIEQEVSTLDNAEIILGSLSEFKELADGDMGALSNLTTALSRLQSIPSNARAEELASRLESVLIELRDLTGEIENWSDEIEVNPSKLAALQERLDSLYRAQQKHQASTVEELKDIHYNLAQSSINQESMLERIAELEVQVAKLLDSANQASERLSAARLEIIPTIQESLNVLFAELDLPHAHIEFKLNKAERLGPRGADNIDINFSANPGSPLKAIETVASGGEISRVILAIKACFGQAMDLPTLILDEIDTGVSGETARKVAKVMAKMGENSQVVAISHLPQIAAQAHHHYKVSKKIGESQSNTFIHHLNEDQRVDEIAEMMTGKSLTDAARESARTLLSS